MTLSSLDRRQTFICLGKRIVRPIQSHRSASQWRRDTVFYCKSLPDWQPTSVLAVLHTVSHMGVVRHTMADGRKLDPYSVEFYCSANFACKLVSNRDQPEFSTDNTVRLVISLFINSVGLFCHINGIIMFRNNRFKAKTVFCSHVDSYLR